MAIKTRHKRGVEFNSASMSDLVFLLLIFFILLSTLVSPNAIKLLLPNSESKTMAKQNYTVYINADHEFFVEQTMVGQDGLVNAISELTAGNAEASIVLRSDKTVPVQYVVTVLDAVNRVNELQNRQIKTILATSPPK